MHPDFPDLLEHLQAVEKATGMAVGKQATEILRDLPVRHPLRKDLIDIATGFCPVGWEGVRVEVHSWTVTDAHGTRTIPKTVRIEFTPENEP